MVEGDGFEPSKAVPADLQSDPFGHSGTPQGVLSLIDVFPTQQSSVIWWRGTDSNHRRQCQQIYSLIPLPLGNPSRVFYPIDVFPTQQSSVIWWRGTDSNHRRQCQQIYSLIPLATREPLQGVLSLIDVFPTQQSSVIWWRGTDSNHRRYKPADLQSAPFGHSGTPPGCFILG